MNNYDFNGYVYDDLMPFNNITLPNMQNVQNQNPTMNNQINTLNNNMLATPYEGYLRGNLFNNLYQQYKNYRPAKLVPKNEQEEAFLNLSQMSFAAHELNLYLDNFPNDRNMINLFNQYRTMTNRLMKEYEEKYGPLTVSSETLNQFPWMWSTKNFPWDEGGM